MNKLFAIIASNPCLILVASLWLLFFSIDLSFAGSKQTINLMIDGKLTINHCSINIDAKNASIRLVKDYSAKNSKPVDFRIEVNGCSLLRPDIQFIFQGAEEQNALGSLKIDSSLGNATGLAIFFSEKGATTNITNPIDMPINQLGQAYQHNGTTKVFIFSAKLIEIPNQIATTGSISASFTVIVHYR